MSNLGLFGISVLITFALIVLSLILLFGIPLLYIIYAVNGSLVQSVTGAAEHSTTFSILVSLLGIIEILLFSSIIYGILYLFCGK